MADEVIRDIINGERDALEELYKSGECEGFPEKGFWLTDSKTLRKSYSHWEKVAYEKYLWELRFERWKQYFEDSISESKISIDSHKVAVRKSQREVEYNTSLIENAKMLLKYHYDYSSIQRLEFLELAKENLECWEVGKYQSYLAWEEERFKHWSEQLERLLAKRKAAKW